MILPSSHGGCDYFFSTIKGIMQDLEKEVMKAPKINKKLVILKQSNTFARFLNSIFGEIIIALSWVMSNNAVLSGVLLSLELFRGLSWSTHVMITNIFAYQLVCILISNLLKNDESSNSTCIHSQLLAKLNKQSWISQCIHIFLT